MRGHFGALGNKHGLGVPPSKGGRMRQNDSQVCGAQRRGPSFGLLRRDSLPVTEFGAAQGCSPGPLDRSGF